MTTININGVRYHYQTTQANSMARPLVFLHGFTGSAANWRSHMDTVAATRPTIAIDLIGHGQTDAPIDPQRYSMDHSAQDLAALLGQIAPGPVDLVGYSMGGRLALYFALTYPNQVQRLFLESASPGLISPTERVERALRDEALADRIERDGVSQFVDLWEAVPLFASQKRLPDAICQQLRQQRLANRAQGLANSLRGMGTGIQPSLWSRLGELEMPVHLLVGALDTKFCAIAQEIINLMEQAGRTADLLIAPDAGHTVHLEKPTLFNKWLYSEG